MRILFIGDIFAKSGRKAISEKLSLIKKKYDIDFVIANAENTSHGRSITIDHYNQLIGYGINVMTMGNHTFDHQLAYITLKNAKWILRPYNIKISSKEAKYGKGTILLKLKNKSIRITNLVSQQCFNKFQTVNPFVALEKILSGAKKSDLHIVDFHAETTSEKKAFLLHFAGKVSAILGTHTHVQTADEQIYNNTFFITDVGMTGPKDGIIGAKAEPIIKMFCGKSKYFKMEPARGRYQFNAVVMQWNDQTLHPEKIIRINF